MNPFVKDIEKLLLRDLGKLEDEINAYKSEDLIWARHEGISNSAGNLCLHLCGNLQHYTGAVLGGASYRRDRDREFGCTFLTREELIAAIRQTRFAVTDTLPKLKDEDLDGDYPVPVFQHPMSTRFFLIHLASHLNYHLGQINYHRRILG
jgi:uncharacterized damage-inducible protein DinB